MRFADLVAAADAVAGTPSRSAKVAILAELLRRLHEDGEVEMGVALLTRANRHGPTGAGPAAVRAAAGGPSAAVPTLTVGEVDDVLAGLAGTAGPGSAAARRQLLASAYARATDREADLLGRLLLGDLRLGALDGLVTDAVARAAKVPLAAVRRAAMLAGALPAVASLALRSGEDALAAVGLRVLTPVLPMLASTSTSAAEAIEATGRASVEWKIDGARIQAHRAGDEIRLFTRNLNDVTARLPGIAATIRDIAARHVILDGEVVGFVDEGDPEVFQETMSRFSRSGPDDGLRIWLFDCLHVDGRDLIDEPLEVRLEILGGLAPGHCVPTTRTGDADAAQRVLDEALAAGHEGVMVKALSSRYEAGRRGKSWRKVKPVHTLDLVVIAVEWGSGRRRGLLSNLHLGALDPAGGGLVMVGKTFKGLTDELLAWQTGQLLSRETGRRGVVVDVRPELVVEIALDGVQQSTRYPGGVSLRFARVRRYRLDKSPAEADTIEAVRALGRS